MAATIVERDLLTRRALDAVRSVVSLLRSLEPADASMMVPGSEWDVADTAAHLVSLCGRAQGERRRAAAPADLRGLNRRCIGEVGERDLGRLADRLASDATTVLTDVLPALPITTVFEFHCGVPTTVVPVLGVFLGELLVHGWDIAQATDRDWTIDDDDAWTVLTAVATVAAGWVRRDCDLPAGLTERYALVRAGTDCVVSFSFGGGQLTASTCPSPGDAVVIDVDDPVALLLAFPYGRIPSPNAAVSRLASRLEPA
jgi:hypothetical protein